jgi:PAS domain S-box-containing protein
VLVTDIESCEFMAGTQDLHEYRRSGIRAVQSTPLRSRARQPLGMLSTHWRMPHSPTENDFSRFDVLGRLAADLFEHALAEDAVREGEELFRLITQAAPLMIWITDAEGQVRYLNQTYLDFTGLALAAVSGSGWMKVAHPDEVERLRDAYIKASERRQPFQVEQRLRRYDGEYRWVLSAGVPRHRADGSFAGYVGTAIDITDRKVAEAVLSTISQRLIEAHEEERARLARELHDDINQRLGLLSWHLDSLMKAPTAVPTRLTGEITRLREEVVALSTDVQALSHRLHPSRLALLGLEASAAALCREVADQQVTKIHLKAEHIPKSLSPRISLCLYRVLQEALQNAIKHSGVRHVDVSLRGRVDGIELTIQDAGTGFDAEEVATKAGLGLTSMRERMKVVKGALSIESTPGRGTTIRAWVTYRSTSSTHASDERAPV